MREEGWEHSQRREVGTCMPAPQPLKAAACDLVRVYTREQENGAVSSLSFLIRVAMFIADDVAMYILLLNKSPSALHAQTDACHDSTRRRVLYRVATHDEESSTASRERRIACFAPNAYQRQRDMFLRMRCILTPRSIRPSKNSISP